MELKGLKINFLGDSITEMYCASSKEACYVSLIGSRFGAEVRNYGIGGTRIAQQVKKDAAKAHDFGHFTLRCQYMNKDADVVFVMGGTNDYGHGDAPFGKESDREPTTFCGSVHTLFASLKAIYPHAKIVIATPLPRATGHIARSDNQGGTVTMADYCKIIENAAPMYGFYLLKLCGNPDPKLSGFHDNSWYVDGLHPNDEGHSRLADYIAEYLQQL